MNAHNIKTARSASDIAQELWSKLSMLEALLQNTCAERAEAFATMLDSDRDWYLLHCAQMAGELKKQAEQLHVVELQAEQCNRMMVVA